jgi:DNA invertase Pin-like site-specific DNA recombinase
MAAVAEREAALISNRTKAALPPPRPVGKKLGGNRGVKLAPKVRKAGRAELVKRAKARATELAPTIAEIREEGISATLLARPPDVVNDRRRRLAVLVDHLM